jgi:hypothetical protein
MQNHHPANETTNGPITAVHVTVMSIALILVGAVLVVRAQNRMRTQSKSRWFSHLTGWQKLFGVVALAFALVVVINPEFIVLGLMGDTAFFDMLVFLLAVQGHALAARAYQLGRMPLREVGRRWGIPSPGLVYILTALAFAARSLETAVSRLWQRIFPAASGHRPA